MSSQKDTDGSLKLDSKVFEADNKIESLVKARSYFEHKYPFCDAEEMLYSTPKKHDGNYVSATGDGNSVVQVGKYNTNLGNIANTGAVHIGDVYGA